MKTICIIAVAVLVIIAACGVSASVNLFELGIGVFMLSFALPNGLPSFGGGK